MKIRTLYLTIKQMLINIYRIKLFVENIKCPTLLKNRSRKYKIYPIIFCFLHCSIYATAISRPANFSMPQAKKVDDQFLKLLQPTLDYLHNCHDAKIDWTTSLPIASPTQKIRSESAEACMNENMHTYYNAEINENILDSIAGYFKAKSIICPKENIKVRYSSFDVLRDLYSALQIDKDDTVLIIAPTYGYYIYQAAEHNLKTKLVFAQKKNGWKITPDELENALQTSKAKFLIFTNPVNPTGVFYNRKEVEAIAVVIKKFNVFTISDEIFSDISFDTQNKPYSLAAVNGMKERTITLSGLGKARGIRLSFACCHLNYVSTLPGSGILRPIQAGAVEALKNNKINKTYLADTMENYRTTIKYIIDKLELMNQELNKHYQTKNVKYIQPYILPEATNIFLISFPGILGKKFSDATINNSLDLAKYIHRSAYVATVPGEGFFIDGKDMVLRIPMSVSHDELSQGFNGILRALKELS